MAKWGKRTRKFSKYSKPGSARKYKKKMYFKRKPFTKKAKIAAAIGAIAKAIAAGKYTKVKK